MGTLIYTNGEMMMTSGHLRRSLFVATMDRTFQIVILPDVVNTSHEPNNLAFVVPAQWAIST